MQPTEARRIFFSDHVSTSPKPDRNFGHFERKPTEQPCHWNQMDLAKHKWTLQCLSMATLTMSDEESVAELLAKMSQTKKNPPRTRRSGRAHQTNNKHDSESEQPTPVANKRAKKGSDEVKALKQQIWALKKANAELNATLEGRTTEVAKAKAARKEQETLVKQQKKQISSLKACIHQRC